MHGEENKFDGRENFSNLARRINAIEQRHGDVQENEVVFGFQSRLDERLAIFDCADQFIVGLQ